MENDPISNRWVYKDAISGFCVLVFTLFLCGLFIKKIVPDTDYSSPVWLFIISIFLIFNLLYSIASYRISKVRKNNFKFSLLNDSIIFKQAVLFADTTKSFLYGQTFGWLPDSIMLISVGTKIIRQNEFSINYSDIESFYVKRGLSDRLFGLYRLIFTFKNTTYWEFNSPITTGVVGISSPEGTFNALKYKGANIAVIPGLSAKKLDEIKQILQKKVSGVNQPLVPKQATTLGVLVAILYGIIAFFVLMVVIVALQS